MQSQIPANTPRGRRRIFQNAPFCHIVAVADGYAQCKAHHADPSMSTTFTARDQYFLELVNRARLDPLAEAARLLADPDVSQRAKDTLDLGAAGLNRGLAAGTISGLPLQVLAPNDDLRDAALGHSQWMLDADVFSHTGAGGSSAGDRIAAAGYAAPGTFGWGENLSWQGTTGVMNMDAAVLNHHAGLFGSDGHRRNILTDWFSETGVAQERGFFLSQGTNWDASMLTQKFGTVGSDHFLTGVAYADADGDGFYSMGEAQAGVTIAAGAGSTVTAAAGGYALALAPSASVAVTLTWGAVNIGAIVDLSAGNVKLDLVSGAGGILRLLSSSDLVLGANALEGQLLGAADLDATGNDAANVILGNAGDNTLHGGAGDDILQGGAGDDTIIGGSGTDTARFSGNRADYTVTTNTTTGVTTVADQRGPGTPAAPHDGTDTVSQVRYLQFADQVLDLTPPPPPGQVAVSGTVSMREVTPGAVNPGGTTVRFTATNGEVTQTSTDNSGAFSFNLATGTSGTLEVLRDWSTAAPAQDKALNVNDVLRLFNLVAGNVAPANYDATDIFAADYNRNGQANVQDVIDLFRFVAGQPGGQAPQYVFIDQAADHSAVDFANAPLPGAMAIGPLSADLSLSMTAILAGDLNGHV